MGRRNGPLWSSEPRTSAPGSANAAFQNQTPQLFCSDHGCDPSQLPQSGTSPMQMMHLTQGLPGTRQRRGKKKRGLEEERDNSQERAHKGTCALSPASLPPLFFLPELQIWPQTCRLFTENAGIVCNSKGDEGIPGRRSAGVKDSSEPPS